MNARITYLVLAGLLAASATGAAAQGRGRKSDSSSTERPGVTVNGGIRIVFTNRDTELLREHYAPRYRNLPPGLQKKLARTGTLPPGWQKKMEPFPEALERRLEPLPAGFQRGVIDGHAVIVSPGTSVIIDARVLF